MKERIYAFDWIRLLAFQAIIIFHASWAIWLDPSGPPRPLPTAIWRFMNDYARVFAFSGFVIVFMTSFLFGRKEHGDSKTRWLPYFMFVGWILFWLCTYFKEKTLWVFQWDIYPLIIVGWLSGRCILKQSLHVRRLFIVISVLMLCLPLWKLQNVWDLPFWLRQILFGLCPEDYADWPLLPWVALLWLGLLLGNFVQLEQKSGLSLHLRRWEYPLIALVLVALFSFRDRYFRTELGDGWSCYSFRQEPWVFWSHMLFWMSLMRLAMCPQVQKLLAASRVAQGISSLAINRHFFLAYLWHYLLLFSLLAFFDPEQRADNMWFLDALIITLLPLTELMTHTTAKLFNVSASRPR